MKKCVFILLMCMMGALTQAGLLVNGNFEDGDLGSVDNGVPGWNHWGSDGWHHNDTGAVIDSKGMKFWWDSTGMWQDYTASAGTTYVYSVQVMDSSGDTTANNWDFRIEAEFYDAAMNMLSADVLGYFDSGLQPDDVWTQVGGSVLAPEATAYGRVILRLWDWQPDISGAIYFDNVSVVPEPATMVLLSIGLAAVRLHRRR